MLQEVIKRVDLAFQAFFRRVKTGETPGYPRFKGYGRYDSITYTQSGFELNDNILSLSKIGDVKIKLHRPIEGNIKRLNIRRSITRKWYVSILTDNDSHNPLEYSDNSVGVDVGITTFAALSDGTSLKILDSMLKNKRIWQRFKENIQNKKKEHLNEERH